MNALLRVENLGKAFLAQRGLAHTLSLRILSRFNGLRSPENIYVFENVTLTVNPGECVAIRGANGSGKSTFLRCIAGVTHPTKGRVAKNGQTLALLSHGFGAYEDLAVWRNVLLAQQLFGLPESLALKNIESIAKLAGLSDRLTSPSTQLSEGMRAKIALTALTFCPFDLLLIDESLNHVDADFRQWFYDLTREWIKQGRSILFTSHDNALLDQFGTRQLKIQNKSLIAIA